MFKTRPQDPSGWRRRLFTIIFEHDSPTGKFFDVVLLWAILLSVVAVILESVASIRLQFGPQLRALEWAFTVLFTVEYVLRLVVIDRPARYARSFFGIVDVLAILPTYLSLFFAGTQTLIVIRALRLLRVFRVLKLAHFVGAEKILGAALRASARKITVFLGAVMTLVLIMGSLMYLIEGPAHGFDSIPRGMYWAIVTLTTVGFGDITPQTLLGQLLASAVMMMGYAILAVPTGIVTVELSRTREAQIEENATTGEVPVGALVPPQRLCSNCGFAAHDADAVFCKRCGTHVAAPRTAPTL